MKAGHRQDIDALRAVAVSLVVVFHAYPNLFPQGFIGVDIFFVISGFLITSIIREDLEQARFSFFLFYARRCRRILPALLTVLAAVWVCGRAWLAPDEFVRLGKHLWAAASFISNEVQWNESGYFDVESASKPLLHLWSLAVEEQFYVIWPVLLFGAHKLGRSGGDRIAVVLLGATSLGLTFVLADSPAYVFFGFPTRAWELTLGCALALWTTGTQKRTNPRRDDLLSGVGCWWQPCCSCATKSSKPKPGRCCYRPAERLCSSGRGQPRSAIARSRVQPWFSSASSAIHSICGIGRYSRSCASPR
ncbi:MAG TPA: acyltransferase [Polyangiales bacterium]